MLSASQSKCCDINFVRDVDPRCEHLRLHKVKGEVIYMVINAIHVHGFIFYQGLCLCHSGV